MSRTERDCREPVECRSCKALVLWVVWEHSKKRMPINVTPAPSGTVVVAFRKASNQMMANVYREPEHIGRNRYESHFATCPQNEKWRKTK